MKISRNTSSAVVIRADNVHGSPGERVEGAGRDAERQKGCKAEGRKGEEEIARER